MNLLVFKVLPSFSCQQDFLDKNSNFKSHRRSFFKSKFLTNPEVLILNK